MMRSQIPQGTHDQRVCVIAPEKQCIEFAEPAFQRGESGTILPSFYFTNERRLIGPKQIKVEVMAAAAEVAGAAERISLGMNAESLVSLDKFKLDTTALATMTGTAHDWTPAFEA